jgi:hypothetical protein
MIVIAMRMAKSTERWAKLGSTLCEKTKEMILPKVGEAIRNLKTY